MVPSFPLWKVDGHLEWVCLKTTHNEEKDNSSKVNWRGCMERKYLQESQKQQKQQWTCHTSYIWLWEFLFFCVYGSISCEVWAVKTYLIHPLIFFILSIEILTSLLFSNIFILYETSAMIGHTLITECVCIHQISIPKRVNKS